MNNRLTSLILMVGVLTTVAVSPTWTYDPINLVKALIVTIGSFVALGIVLANHSLFNFNSKQLIPVYFFGLSILVPLFFAESPINQQLWGIFGRNSGALTLIASFLIILICSLSIHGANLAKMVRTIFALNVFLMSYCLVQIAGLDPVAWSQFAPFATLGNVNFLSAILGMFSVTLFVQLVYSNERVSTKLIFAVVLSINIFIMLKTDSIQGPVIFLIGASFTAFCFAWQKRRKMHLVLMSLIFIPIYTGGIFGLNNQGPLGAIVYQPSNVFRADYMSAAWNTFTENIVTGVGHDSFDGWYRTERGFISAFRTNPLRTTNSAHNIYLDMAANGGLLLFISYLGVVLLTLTLAMRHVFKSRKLNVNYAAILGAWIAFIVQSAISINQIGVSVWGWIFTGTILGLSSGKTNDSLSDVYILESRKLKKSRGKKKPTETLSARSVVFATIFGLVGLLSALPPALADSRYKNAMSNRNLNELLQVAQMQGTTAFHLGTIIDLARKSNYEPQAIQVSDRLTTIFPRDFFGWNVRMTFASLSNELRGEAYKRAKEIDPYFYCADVNPIQSFLIEFDRLPISKKYELVRWWGLVPFNDSRLPSNDDWLATLTPKITQRAATFCGS